MQTTLLDRPDDIPSFPEALAALKWVPDRVYAAAEDAAFRTSQFRDQESPGTKLDSGLSACLFRFHALRMLRSAGLEAQEDEFEWALDPLPFLGISFLFEEQHVRILKGPNGALPGCGTSDRRHRFYNQLAEPHLRQNRAIFPKVNFIVLWDFTFSYGLSGLWLACPAVGGKRAQDVSAYWCEPLMHPMEGLGTPQGPPPPDDDLSGMMTPLRGEEPKKAAK